MSWHDPHVLVVRKMDCPSPWQHTQTHTYTLNWERFQQINGFTNNDRWLAGIYVYYHCPIECTFLCYWMRGRVRVSKREREGIWIAANGKSGSRHTELHKHWNQTVPKQEQFMVFIQMCDVNLDHHLRSNILGLVCRKWLVNRNALNGQQQQWQTQFRTWTATDKVKEWKCSKHYSSSNSILNEFNTLIRWSINTLQLWNWEREREQAI